MSVPNEIKELVDRFKNNYNDYKKPTYLEAELLSYQKMGRKWDAKNRVTLPKNLK
jgi:hypothetical protein